MKEKTMRLILSRKMEAWLKSIKDEGVRKLAARDSIITGGAIASMLLGEDVNDYDIYFATREACAAVARYYVQEFCKNPPTKHRTGMKVNISVDDGDYEDEKRVRIIIKSAGVASEDGTNGYAYFEHPPEEAELKAEDYIEQVVGYRKNAHEPGAPAGGKYRPVFLSSNAITLSDKVQLVCRFHGKPSEIHKNYDFLHCTNYYTHINQRLVLKKAALLAILNKELVYVGSRYPVCSMFRIRKFINRGWTITAGQMLKIAVQISQLNLSEWKTLEEQLIGVDVAYFNELLALLHPSVDDPKKVDLSYLGSLIDKVF